MAPTVREFIKPLELLPNLMNDQVINSDDKENIEQRQRNEGDISATDLLLERITCKSQFGYRSLRNALSATKQTDVAKMLDMKSIDLQENSLSTGRTRNLPPPHTRPVPPIPPIETKKDANEDNAYKDFRIKDALWESNAATMGKDADILKIWYRYIPTRYTRQVHRKSGDGAAELTERDRWILMNFAWLRAEKKTTASVHKEDKALAASVDDGNDVQSEDPTDTETVTNTRDGAPLLKVSKIVHQKGQEEKRLLSNIAEREEQFIAFETKELALLASSNFTERTRYADWAKEVMVNIHPANVLVCCTPIWGIVKSFLILRPCSATTILNTAKEAVSIVPHSRPRNIAHKRHVAAPASAVANNRSREHVEVAVTAFISCKGADYWTATDKTSGPWTFTSCRYNRIRRQRRHPVCRTGIAFIKKC
ncbi:LOW QUALITY PROTEIN: hypothetical protein MAR_000983 [Mya arenaria]|uniref:Caspase recruitment domain-containing protein n=1 Tax=Mya arenaria TaxID=6604 RepID=A0ABY7FAE4_MYAAR|nr:LOW QUALITY PROTEIN: hypothetical protein MAR_000983 [Mya arenaria]